MEMAQNAESKKMTIQLLEGNDPSAEADRSALGRWREYLDSYVLRQPTEWMPELREEGRSAVFLRKWVCLSRVWCANLMDENRWLSGDESTASCNETRIRIRLGTYKLLYEAGTEDVLIQRRSREEEKVLEERVRRRNEERRRCRLLQD